MKEILDKINLDTWIISDLHLGHGNGTKGILTFEPCRLDQMIKDGYIAEDHNEWLIDNWNKVVKENDIVLLLGDFAFKQLINKRVLRNLYEQYKEMSKEEFADFIRENKIKKLTDL